MKKNVLIVILAVLVVAAVVYAQKQKARADFCDRIGLQKDGSIQAMTKSIETLRKIAADNMNEAIMQSNRADEAVARCGKSRLK